MRLRFVLLLLVASCRCGEIPGADAGSDADSGIEADAGVVFRGPAFPPGASLRFRDVTDSTATVAWPQATDDVAVTGYAFKRDGVLVSEGLSLEASLTGLSVGQFARLSVIAKDGDGNESLPLEGAISGVPALIVPPSDVSISTDFCASVQFLFTGAAPFQRGADASRLPCASIAGIHGRALTPNGSPLPGLTVSVPVHPEFGTTLTRGDGSFDLIVTAGIHVVQLSAPVFLPVHREVVATKGRFSHLDGDVVLLTTDPKATAISLPAGGLHTSTPKEDKSGKRAVHVYIPPGTTALAELPDGTTRGLATVTVRVTEYTVGDRGPEAMPAPLPEASAYTFAAEFTVDEAKALGATGVRFSQPVVTWVENFLNSPLCTQVPQGRYDAQQQRWVAEPSSLVVATAPGGLDVTGDGVADSAGVLLDGEAEALAATFQSGTSLVRTLTTHFSPRDDNYPWRCDGSCTGSDRRVPEKCPSGCRQRGSIIDCQNQTVSEAFPVPGTGLSLLLHSHRQPRPFFKLDFPLTTSVDGGVRGALSGRIVLDIAGQRLVADVPDAGEGSVASVVWDGKDGLGRTVRGPVEGTLQAGFLYGRANASGAPSGMTCSGALLRYGATPSAFGNLPAADAATTGRSRDARYFSNSQPLQLGTWVGPEDLGGLSLDIVHGASASTGTVFYGDGDFSKEADVGATTRLYAGGGLLRDPTAPSRNARLTQVAHLTAAPDGSLYFVDNGSVVRRVSADGQRVEIVGGSFASRGFSGDGADARMATFQTIDGLAISPQGDVFVSDTGNARIRRIDGRTNVITTVVGNGTSGRSTSGMRALDAPLNTPNTLLWGRDGRLYFFIYSGNSTGDLLFRLTEGVIEKVGGSEIGAGVEADSAHNVSFGTFGKRMAAGVDGSLYVVDNRTRVRRIFPDGRVRLVGGAGTRVEDGVRARDARLGDPMGVAVDASGVVVVADRGGASSALPGGRIRMISADERITTIAGSGLIPRVLELDRPGTSAALGESREVAILPDGRVAFSENFYGTIQVLQRAWDLSLTERGVGSRDGSEVYVFDASGRHLQTIETLTGVVVWRFEWDAAGRLARLTDRNGDVTTVLRDAQGRFAGLRAQDGQTLTATLDGQGRVASLADARSRTVRMTWNADGLPASWTDENGGETAFTYDADGKLIAERDALGGSKSVTRQETKEGYVVTYTTAEGRATRYEVQESGRFRLYTNRFPDGTVVSSRNTGGRESTFFPDGTLVDESFLSDTRFGSQSPFSGMKSTRLPSGLTRLDGRARQVTLDTQGNVLSLSRHQEDIFINGRNWRSVFTAADKTWRHTTPMGRLTTVVLDDKGRPVSWQAPGVASTSVTYDARGRATRMAQGTRRLDVAYGPNGFASIFTDALSRVTSLATDTTGQLDSATRPDNEVYAFAWDAKGNLSSLTPPGKPAHGFLYTMKDELSSYAPPTLPNVGNETYGWTRDSEVRTVGHPDGTSTALTRDAAGRATRIQAPWATSTFDYSAMTGQLQTSTRAGQRLDWTYDGQLPVRETSSGVVGGSVSRRYDSDFRVIEVAVNDAGVGYAYDNDSLLTAAGPVALGRSATTGQLLTSTTGNVVTSYTYDVYGAPASIETRVGGSVIFREVLTWDDIGRVSAKDVTVQGTATRWDYAYDAASRLVQARRDGTTVGAWGYDGNGNRLTADGVTSTFDTQDRQLTSGATTFTHDAFGSRTAMTATGQTTRYVYDGVGGLLSATLPDGTALEYVIDSRGRRVGKKRNGALEKGWLYDGQLRIVAEVDATGAVTSRFVYGTSSHSPDVMLRAGVTYRYVHDALGSVRLVVNVSTGQVVQHIDYDSWGVVTSDSSPGFQPFAFAGGLFDVDTQLTRFGARDYDAATGRWTSKDPIRLEGGINLYAYARNTPISFVDVWGLAPLSATRRAEVQAAINRIGCIQAYEPYAELLQTMLTAGTIQETEPGWKEVAARAREATGAVVPAYHSAGVIYLRSSSATYSLTQTLLHELFHDLSWRDRVAEDADNTPNSVTTRIEDDFREAEASNTNHKYDSRWNACKCKAPGR